MKKVDTIRKYYDLWITADRSGIEDLIAEDIVYTESYGPQHHGLTEIIKWFDDWTPKAKVIRWDITNYFEQDKTCAVEWFFQFEMDGVVRVSDGASIAEFDDHGKIAVMKEFQAEHAHHYPYAE